MTVSPRRVAEFNLVLEGQLCRSQCKQRSKDRKCQWESNASPFPAGQLIPFILVTFLFFLWGIPNNLNDVLIRQFMKSFSISRFQAGLVQSAFYMGYFLLAMPAALVMRKAGYRIHYRSVAV